MQAAQGRGWIRSPGYDLIFFSTLWMAPFLLALYYGLVGVGVGAALIAIAYHVLLRLPHLFETMRVTYLNPDNWNHYRTHWVTYAAIPLGLLALYGLPLASAIPAESLFVRTLAVLATVWGTHHVGMQNFGILSLYRRRAGLKPDPSAQNLERRILQLLVALASVGALAGWVSPAGLPPTAGLLAVAVSWSRVALLAAVLAAIALYLWRTVRKGETSGPLLAYLTTAVLVMVRWPFYDRLPTPGLRAGMHFLVFNGHHCAAYLGLCFLMYCNRREQGQPAFAGLGGGARKFTLWLLPLALISAGAIGLTSGWVLSSEAFDKSLLILQGTFVVHYFLEGQVWKFSEAHNRKVTLPLLRQPLLAPAFAPAGPAWNSGTTPGYPFASGG